jgi:hypothetical protein
MKKFLFSVLFLFVVLIACSKEEEPTPPPTPKFTVSFSASEGGSVSTEGGSYDQGTMVTVTATPDGEFHFDKWSDGNTENPREITITSNLSLTANFVRKKYALTVNIEGEGTVQEEVIVQGSTSTTEYNSGTSVRLTATPAEGWEFSKWSGGIESQDNPLTVEVMELTELTVEFTRIEYEITINKIGEGNIELTETTGAGDPFRKYTIEAEGVDDFYLLAWYDGSNFIQAESIEIELNENKSINAYFVSEARFRYNIFGVGDIKIRDIHFEPINDQISIISRIDLEIEDESLNDFRGWGGLTDQLGGVETNIESKVSIDLEERGYQLRVYFSQKPGISKIDYEVISIPEDVSLEAAFNTITNPNTVTYYSNSSGEYIVFLPSASNLSEPNLLRNAVTPGFGVMFKKIEGYWKFFRIDRDISGWGFRNFKQFDNTHIVVGDGNEIGPNAQDWQGDLYFGRINGNDVNWTRVNSDDQMLYYHGTTGGDLNNDGLIDIGGTGSSGFNIFFQNADGSFSIEEDIVEWSDEISDYIGGIPFAWEFKDVFGDSRSEIIMADYGAGDPSENEKLNNISVWKFDEEKQKFKLHFLSNEPTKLFSYGRGATKILAEDINNDGIQDLIIAGEDELRSIETWLGNGDGTFKSNWGQTFNNEVFGFAEFFLLDANNDGYIDIILNGLNKNPNNVIESDTSEVGINFNSAVWLNNGNGTFQQYGSKVLQDDFGRIAFGIPYMKNGKLHFFGSFNPAHLIDTEKREILVIQQDISFSID